MNKKYVIRREILNMTGNEWHKLDGLDPSGEIEISPRRFLDEIGLPSGMSARYNDDEKEFFRKIYTLARDEIKSGACKFSWK